LRFGDPAQQDLVSAVLLHEMRNRNEVRRAVRQLLQAKKEFVGYQYEAPQVA